jgi:hypothetical protein
VQLLHDAGASRPSGTWDAGVVALQIVGKDGLMELLIQVSALCFRGANMGDWLVVF